MATYRITIPISGEIVVHVDAESEEAAESSLNDIDLAFEISTLERDARDSTIGYATMGLDALDWDGLAITQS